MAVSLDLPGPSQSEQVAQVIRSNELAERVAHFAFTPSNYQAIFRRIFDNQRISNGHTVANRCQTCAAI